MALEPTSSNSGPLMFGADLQSIVDRELMDLKVREVKGREVGRIYEGIPRLVQKCIEEVELRGMKVCFLLVKLFNSVFNVSLNHVLLERSVLAIRA